MNGLADKTKLSQDLGDTKGDRHQDDPVIVRQHEQWRQGQPAVGGGYPEEGDEQPRRLEADQNATGQPDRQDDEVLQQNLRHQLPA